MDNVEYWCLGHSWGDSSITFTHVFVTRQVAHESMNQWFTLKREWNFNLLSRRTYICSTNKYIDYNVSTYRPTETDMSI